MSEEHTAEAVELDPGAFDLGSWLAGKSTSTTYTTKVRTDLESFRRVVELQERGQQVHADLVEARKAAEKSAGSASLGEVTPAAAEVDELTKEFESLRKEYNRAAKLLKASELTIVFSADDRKAQRGLMPVIQEHFPEVLAGTELTQSKVMSLMREHPEIMEKQNAVMLHSTIASITNSRGGKVVRGQIELADVEKLIASVGNPDREKLYRHMNLAINSSNLTEEAIDAGFPG